ncbi:MarR family winged helix-turn-helix transcriptional regulator [Candidatus Galacturonibacter soehngenii]|uniref:HTH-type transcriptional regulator SarZ n=1 Tax=Candidatus Galacturonatibacter soehngenii TaxID=2307010 RepID=A0A7V7QIR7_9FIRM|nr:MarR family winged helix-turn-helix transcriptional regulator [Candidatus Galacturonibacter soehngenii]KAB1436602.1 winged helix-turn-helix transcriptional regulator [Candidatus Galacturonibacter soehngenii]MBA4688688.1 winged helix-turn-helix transcriptional regulator [Candidatus Galacturonibacter soehngenii]
MWIFEGKVGDVVDIYNSFNEILVNLFNDIMDIEEKALITDEFKDITGNDMHIIDAIGIGSPRNMSTVAKTMSVTVGTLTIAINSLVKKNYVERVRSEEDRRVVLLSLSEKGKKAYHHHQKFHDDMIKATIKGLSKDETLVLVKAITNMTEFFKNYH